jgi:excisionase family DNA binding protein
MAHRCAYKVSQMQTSFSEILPVRRGFRIREAAVYMGLSPWSVEVLIRSKKLPALKLCRHYTILKEEMDAFLERSKEAVTAA